MTKVVLYNQIRDQTINLTTEATTTIGRGFFGCEDVRVSRKHGEITVLENQIRIKACHVNPIFYKKNGENIQQILERGSEILLNNADKFSLLPEEFEYEIQISRNDPADPVVTTDFRVRGITEINENLEAGNIATSLSQIIGERSNQVNNDEDSNETKSDISSRSPSPVAQNAGDQSLEQLPALPSRKRSIETASSTENCKKPKQSIEVQPVTIKADPDAASTSVTSSTPASSTTSTIVKPDPDAPAPAVASSVKEEKTPDVKPNPSQPGMRPSCEHGIRCYRHTPEHRLEAAHPSDADYRRPNLPPAPLNSPNCPFGAACYRRNPSHFLELAHPPSSLYSTHPPARIINVVRPVIHVNPMQIDDDHELISEEEEEDYDDDDADQDFVADEIDDEEEEENNLEE